MMFNSIKRIIGKLRGGSLLNSAFNFGSRPGGAKYIRGLSSSNRGVILDHGQLRQNIRRAATESPYLKGIINRSEQMIVDNGIMPEPSPIPELLGKTPEFLEAWSEDVTERFSLWCKNQDCYRSGIMNFYQAQHLYARQLFRDNDVFIRLYYNNSMRVLNPLQFAFLDPSQISGSKDVMAVFNNYFLRTGEGSTNIYGQIYNDDGIVRDVAGREIAYNIIEFVNGKYKNTIVLRKGARSGKTQMLHGFVPDYAGQGRGYPLLSHAIQDFKNITDFSESVIKKAIAQSSISFYVKPNENDPGANPFEDVPSGVRALSATENVPIVDEDGEDVTYNRLAETAFDTPGTVGVFNLRRGQDLRPFENTAPPQDFKVFIDTLVSYLTASVGMPAEVLRMQFTNNYSASRGALAIFYRVARIFRSEIESDFLQPIYENWLAGEIASGRVQAPGWNNLFLRNAWANCSWYGGQIPNIDPLKESAAVRNNLQTNMVSAGAAARDLNGSSIKKNIAKNNKIFPTMAQPYWTEKKGGI